MKFRWFTVAFAMVSLGVPASAHRLDEYLQATIISIEKDHVQVEMRLVPGIAVASFILTGIDSDADGMISEGEQRAYVERVLRDTSLRIDGQILRPQLMSIEFPEIDAMKEGLGEIHITFGADLPRGARDRRIIFENHHQSGIAAYLVNVLAPSDSDIRIVAQARNEQQTFYQLDYIQDGASLSTLFAGRWHGVPGWLWILAFLLLVRLAFLCWWRNSARRVFPGGIWPIGTRTPSELSSWQ